ncbi:hypothetical protein B0H16DRAFT_1375298 [Mycena metata]|uniref:C2H2-type domain-containing protein n=1 Tax=Mycena metata TaxID=1033252 RepID=A0AAD7IPJ9_9AGAR|nr:hypothetical protein B0H16DRAFT_1375298 [Mycena metata]
MSLTLPMEALSAMQVSFRVCLPDGKFTFDMAAASETTTAQLESGMKLLLHAVRDATGVTLTLSTSGPSTPTIASRLEAGERPEDVLEFPPPGPLPTSKPHTLQDIESDQNSMDFLSYSHMDDGSKPLTLDYFPSNAFQTLNMSLEVPDDPTNFNDYFFDTLNAQNSESNSRSAFSYGNNVVADLGEAKPLNTRPTEIDIARDKFNENFTLASHSPPTDTDATTPSVSSESSPAYSPPPGPQGSRSKLRCPEPACGRHFTSKYTLSKHVKAHEPKSQKSFPCTMGCAMRFSRKHDRLRHEVTQHGRVCDWGCRACLGFFSSEVTLKKHKCKNAGGARWVSDQS